MGKYKKALGEYKFKKRPSLGNFFTEKLWQALDLLLNSNENIVDPCWVPVPARPGKIKHNGWDQIEYAAALLENDIRQRTLEKTFSIPVRRCLKRLPSPSQKELNKESRLQNLKGRIITENKTVPKTAVLFDDVYTTGSTMDACAAALKSAGAKKVYGICLCYD